MIWLAAFASPPADLAFRGVCDGSAAVLVPGARVLVAYDEDRMLHLYDARGGDPLAHSDLATQLKLTDTSELDLEGAESTGERIWWIGSHGNNRNAKPRPNRQSLFATNIPQRADLADLRVVRPRSDLLPLLRRALGLDAATLGLAPKKGGLNIEGLAADDRGLVLGLRSPLTEKDEAWIVRLDPTGEKVIGTHRLDLAKRGIRALTWDGKRFLLIAGAPDKEHDYALYHWDGADTVRELDAPLGDLNPESLVQVSPGRWLVMSDDGAVDRTDWNGGKDGRSECKDIRATNPQGDRHPSVYGRARSIDVK